jgi:putative ATP-binding cassette transporter
MHINIKSDLFDFLSSEGPRELKRMGALSVFVGITNTLLIGLINTAAKDVSTGKSVTLQFFGFALLLIVFLIVTKRANQENIRSANDLIYRFKIRIMNNAFKSNLLKIDKVGRDYIMEVLARDTQLVTNAVSALVSAFQSLATLLFLTIYMGTVSLTACLIILCTAIIVFTVGLIELFKLTDMLQEVSIKEAEVNGIYGAFLSGYKEVKMNSRRALDITREMVTESKRINQSKTRLMLDITNFFNYLQMLLYLVVGLMIFVVPVFSSDFSTHVTTAATTALFLASSLTAVIMNIPTLSLANVASRTLMELSRQLASHESDRVTPGLQEFKDVRSISLENITYTHGGAQAKKAFVLGPLSYTFDVGKVYFIRGNNGSGKTTLMRLLIGLYQVGSGRILVNGEQIAEPANAAYRDLFSVVFSDFFLFKRLYGVPEFDEQEVSDLLKLFKMENKVSIVDGAFSDLSFSTGQRKRLALLVALLEKKQFIILDEWAADQDPEFRQEFYEHIIPTLRGLGKTVIAITHDDQYYDVADHVIYMANGKPITTQE